MISFLYTPVDSNAEAKVGGVTISAGLLILNLLASGVQNPVPSAVATPL